MNKFKMHPLVFNLLCKLKQIYKVVASGGPGGGKTSILALAMQKLQDIGVILLVVPEQATELMTHGLIPGKNISYDDFQEMVFLSTLEREYRYLEIAKKMVGDKVVIVSDRGTMDGLAYTTRESFELMVHKHGYSMSYISEGLYKAVIHFRSLACDFPEYYTCANNKARTETAEQAKLQDAKTEAVWLQHPHLRILGNADTDGKLISLEKKTHLFVAEIAHILGIPEPLEIEKKYLLKAMPVLPEKHEKVEIIQYYLKTPNGEERIRIRTWRGSSVYYRTEKCYVGPGIRSEKESVITASEFGDLLRYADPDRRPITKTRHTFIHNDQYFELDEFTGHFEGLVLLEIELTDRNDKVVVPSFIGEYCEVTDDTRYMNSSLAASKTKYWQ